MRADFLSLISNVDISGVGMSPQPVGPLPMWSPTHLVIAIPGSFWSLFQTLKGPWLYDCLITPPACAILSFSSGFEQLWSVVSSIEILAAGRPNMIYKST